MHFQFTGLEPQIDEVELCQKLDRKLMIHFAYDYPQEKLQAV